MIKLIFLVVLSISTVVLAKPAYDQSKLSTQFQELSKSLHSSCSSKSGVEEATIKKVINGEFPDEHEIKVYMRCILTESGAITDERGPDFELMSKLLPADIEKETILNVKICLGKIKHLVNKEERVFNFFKCYYEQNPKIYIFF